MADKDEVIANLRAVLVSRKGPANLYQLGKDYKELEGTFVPFKSFGFSSLEDFLRSDPTFKLYSQGNETLVSIVPKKESRHISEMISKQKCSKKRSRSAPVPRALRGGNNSAWRPSPTTWNARRSPVKTSKSAQVYAGQPSRQISYNRQNGSQSRSNNSSFQQRLNQAHPSTQLKSIENIVPKPILKEPPKPKAPQNGGARNISLPPQYKPKIDHTTACTVRFDNPEKTTLPDKNIRLPRDSKIETVANGSRKAVVKFDAQQPQQKQPVKQTQSEPVISGPVNNLIQSKLTKPQQVSKEKVSISNRLKRSPIDLETVDVASSSTRSVSMISRSRSSDLSNIQVTMTNSSLSNGATINGERPMKTSAQDRLNRIRQQQPPTPPIVDSAPPVFSSTSQQSRLQKYRNQETTETQSDAENQYAESSPTPVDLDSSSFIDKDIDYEEALLEYCLEKNLSVPQIRVIRHKIPQNTKFKSDRPSSVYGCRVKIGEECTYGSYSDMFNTPREATQVATKNTLDALVKIHGSLEERDLPTTEGHLVPERLLKLIAGHYYGKFLQQLPADYREEYHENMPDDWLTHVKQSRLFCIEDSAGGRQIIFVASSSSWQDSKTGKNDDEDFTEPTQMNLPAPEGYWNVLITNVCSTVEIWARIIGEGYSELYDELLTLMEAEFIKKKALAKSVQVGAYYAVCTPDCWVRVQVLETNTEQALCFYIDTGEEEWHNVSEIYKLDKKFRFVPPQGVLLQMHGLEEMADNTFALPHLIEYVLNKALVADIKPNKNNDDRIISAVLFDTYTNDDINLNSLIETKINADAKAPRLKEKGRVNDVFISHVSDTGEIFVQIRNDTFNYLLTRIQTITEVGFEDEQLSSSKFMNNNQDTEKLYLTLNVAENKWYRVLVTGKPKQGVVSIFFVDYGYTGQRDVSVLFAIEKLSTAVNEYPHQCLKVKLNGMPSFTPAIAARLRGCLPKNSSVLLKVTEPGAVPTVEIFMRTQNDLLISVNNALQNELEIERTSEEVECRTVSKRMERLSFMPRASRNKPLPPSPEYHKHTAKSLPEPKLPCDGSFFPVVVTMAASPANFVIQPYKRDNELGNLMRDLQSLCKNSPSPRPPSSEIEKGNLYAGKHSDGTWYRVQITNVMQNNSVTVHFCDYGDYDVMSCNNLQRLTPPFLKIPYHAIKARLSGIVPQFGDWNVTECLRFQELVCDQVFVSIIHSIDVDDLNPPDKILSVTLIDTSTDKDIYITPELFRKNFAV